MWNPPPPELNLSSSKSQPQNSARNSSSNNRESGYYDLNKNNNHTLDMAPTQRSDNAPYPVIATQSVARPHHSSIPHPRLGKVGPYLTIATLQAYTILTVVRCLADPIWIVLRDKTGTPDDATHQVEIGKMEKSFLACAIAFTMVSCLGVTLRILDKAPWLRRIPVLTAYLEAIFCIAALTSFLSTHSLPPGGQFSHGFLACVITVLFSTIVAFMLTVDWYKGFPSAGLSATLKALIISSFVMTIVIIIGAAIYSSLEGWNFDEAVNFCIVSFATIGYGNLAPKTVAGRIIFFFYGLLGISSMGFFVVSLRNAVIEQFQWRLVDRFSKPAHLTRVQTRMSAKDISFPVARFEEEQRVKIVVKRKMMVRMGGIWVIMWFGGAGVFCAFQDWTYLESLYFCFVTLSTIGFGDLVPTEPGSIEFWNVYVFVGLSVFAYILSLSSESMATQIHLVDDQDEDDDADMYGWERNEDPNAPLTTRSGILGLEGLKWLHHQQQLQQDQQQQDGDQDLQPGQEARQRRASSVGGLASGQGFDDSNSAQSTIERNRSKRKSSTGRILMVSAKERKQMLQAEYYATHSLPTTIRFVDTAGVPHQKVVRRGMSAGAGGVDSTSGPLGGSGQNSLNGDNAGYTYGTVGYYGTIGRRDLAGLSRAKSGLRNQQSFGGVGVANGGTMFGAGRAQILSDLNQQQGAQTQQLQHQPLISFDSPNGSVRNRGPRNEEGVIGLTDRRDSGPGYIPSCMDVFGQRGEGSGAAAAPAAPDSPSHTRMRSNSWNGGAGSMGRGPSQNDIHRWMAEGAGTLPGPDYAYANKIMDQEHELDTAFQHEEKMQNQSSQGGKVSGSASPLSHFSPQGAEVSAQDAQVGIGKKESVAPDEIPLTAEPAEMSSEDEEQFHSPTSSSGKGLITRLREPTLPLESHLQDQAPAPRAKELYLGGGTGAGYGTHAYGVPMERGDSNEGSRLHSRASSTTHLGLVLPSAASHMLMDEGADHQWTLHPTTSRPMSLFSNHRSGQNSNMPSPTGSRNSSRAPSVLMTIFDEPVMHLPGSKTVSRTGSMSGSRSGLQSGVEIMPSSTASQVPSADSVAAALQGGVRTKSPRATESPFASSAGQSPTRSVFELSSTGSLSPDLNVGPFGEVRHVSEMPHFEDDVDLNHIEPSTEQAAAEERQRRQDMRRREKEIEVRLAKLKGKGPSRRPE